MAKLPISVTLITLNEESSIARAIQSVHDWAEEVLLVDCGSTDRTTQIAQDMGARVIYNPWPGYGKQKNFAQDQAKNDWILNIDADEEVSSELKNEIFEKFTLWSETPSTLPNAVAFPRRTFYLGRWIKHGGWYPDYVTRFYHRRRARWTEPAVHEKLEHQGSKVLFQFPLNHFTFMGIEDQVSTNLRYSKEGYSDLNRRGERGSAFKLLFKPVWKFFHCYFFRLGFLDGIPGLIIAVNAAHSIFLKYAYFFEKRHARPTD